MKFERLLWAILLLVFLLCGCVNQIPPAATEPAMSQSETVTASPTETQDEKTPPDVREYASIEGVVTAHSNTSCRIHLKNYCNNSADHSTYSLCIEVDTGSQVLKKVLDSQAVMSPGGSLFLGDVDGDGIQEILVHSDTGGLGGFGLWNTWVLKVDGNEICVLFENFNEYDTGFQSRFLDGYQMEVTNRFTGYTFVFDVKEAHKEYIANSAELPAGSILLDPFYVFEPADTDGDGISEILCKQYTHYRDHADYTGTACSVLKFNTETQLFEVVDAWYEPNIEE